MQVAYRPLESLPRNAYRGLVRFILVLARLFEIRFILYKKCEMQIFYVVCCVVSHGAVLNLSSIKASGLFTAQLPPYLLELIPIYSRAVFTTKIYCRPAENKTGSTEATSGSSRKKWKNTVDHNTAQKSWLIASATIYCFAPVRYSATDVFDTHQFPVLPSYE